MGILNPIKEINKNKIKCNETFKLRIGLTGIPEISDNPADIMLILDRSGSMNASNKFNNMKIGSKEQIDIITTATGGTINGKLGGGSKIGVVSFSTQATLDTPLTNDITVIKDNINKLVANGQTNHGEGFLKAIEAFDPNSKNDKIIIMFTDGAINEGLDPIPITEAAKKDGIEIYCIGVENTANVIENWASKPIDKYIAFSKNPTDLANLFVDIGKRVASSGVSNSKIIETLNDEFEISNIDNPTFGTVNKISNTKLEWNLNGIGNNQREDAELIVELKYIGKTGGTFNVNKDIVYSDDQGNIIKFPNPSIEIDCKGGEIIVEPCPIPLDISVEGCKDSKEITMTDVELSSLGRIIRVNTTIKNVCPNKRVAASVRLVEIDELNKEYSRGMKYFEIPAHTNQGCIDVNMKYINFVVPEKTDVTGDIKTICGIRNFRINVMANYIDTEYQCCK